MNRSRDRQASLSEQIVKAMKRNMRVDWEDDPETVRRRLNRLFGDAEQAHDALDQKAREKIEKQKRNIPEGSAEWETLHSRYLREEYDTIERLPLRR